MKLDKNGEFIEFNTEIGTVEFKDANGHHQAYVQTSGEFWRMVEVTLPRAGLVPDAAIQLGKLLIEAGAKAAAEDIALTEAQEQKKTRPERLRAEKREYWARLVHGHIVNALPTDEVIQAVIDHCVETDLAGDPCGVWHAVSVVTGKPCWCAKCRAY